MPIYDRYVKTYGRGAPQYKPHRKFRWVPMRYCADDWVLAVWVYRCNRQRFEIGLFLCEDHFKYKQNTGLIGALGMCLSEAYHRTGKMELRFVGPMQRAQPSLESGFEPKVPDKVRTLCEEHLGEPLEHSHMINDFEGRKVYAALTGFSQSTSTICQQRNIDLIQAAFVIHREIWNKSQVNYFCSHALYPEALFYSGQPTENRLSFLSDLWFIRIALLGERFRNLVRYEHKFEDGELQYEHISELSIQILASRPISIGNIKEALSFEAILIPASNYDHIPWRQYADQGIIVMTKDFEFTSGRASLEQLGRHNITVISIPDTLAELDLEIIRRLSQSASTRRPIPERPDA